MGREWGGNGAGYAVIGRKGAGYSRKSEEGGPGGLLLSQQHCSTAAAGLACKAVPDWYVSPFRAAGGPRQRSGLRPAAPAGGSPATQQRPGRAAGPRPWAAARGQLGRDRGLSRDDRRLGGPPPRSPARIHVRFSRIAGWPRGAGSESPNRPARRRSRQGPPFRPNLRGSDPSPARRLGVGRPLFQRPTRDLLRDRSSPGH